MSIVDGSTICDYDDAEIRQQRSVGVAVASLLHDGVKVNLVDTPGYADFVGELRVGLRAADCALFVIAANEGVDEPTKSLWQECSRVGMPRAVAITKLDHARANYAEALAAAQDAFLARARPAGILQRRPFDPREFAALLDGLSIQVALEDPEVDSKVAYDIAMRFAERELNLPAETKRAKRR